MMEVQQFSSTASEVQGVDWRRVIIFCLFAFVISGSSAIFVALKGGLAALSQVETFTILGLWTMPGPALANVLTRLVTREGWGNLWLRPRFRHGWRAWLIAWFLPAILILLGGALYFLIFPQHFDPTFGPAKTLLEQAAAAGSVVPFGPPIFILIQIVQALLIAPVINALPTLGEEFGWRAYLQPKLMPLGWQRAMLLVGVIWGVWHWPILAMGYNYGLEYAGAPWWGMLLFVVFTTLLGIVFGWLTIRGGSVWPAVIGHGALNGIAALPALMVQGEPNSLLGPMVFSAIGMLPLLVIAAWMWWHPPVAA